MSAMGLGRKSFARQFSKTLLLSSLIKKGKCRAVREAWRSLNSLVLFFFCVRKLINSGKFEIIQNSVLLLPLVIWRHEHLYCCLYIYIYVHISVSKLKRESRF